MRYRLFYTASFRLAAIYAGVFLISVMALGAGFYLIADHAFRDQIVQFSRADIAAVQSGYASEGLDEAQEVISQRMAAPAASDFFLLQKNGTRVAGNLPPMAPKTGVIELSGNPRFPHGVLGVGEALAPGLYLFSGSDLSRDFLVRARIGQLVFWLISGALVLAIAGGALVSRNFLRRADAITNACRAIIAGDMKARVPLRGTRDELDRLSDVINAMLDRIAALMENIHQITNDIAHDLRTPLSHLRHRLERARTDAATPRDYDAALKGAIAAADDILAVFSALLRIAQIEGGARRAGFAPVDLSALVLRLADIYGPVADDDRHEFLISAEPGIIVKGDKELLTQLFANLIENAIVHTPGGTAIRLQLSSTRNTAIVEISDNGPGVPPTEVEKLFRRLYRLEASRSKPGHGLGLALVSAIADLHGATLLAGSDGGLRVSLTFTRN